MPPTNSNLPLLNVRPRISIDGSERANMGEAALALQVHLPRIGMANAELRLLNWSPTEGGQPDFLFNDLRLGSRIEISLGENAESAIFKGDITAIEERYGDGAPQMVLLAEDALHKLARQRHNRVFEAMSLDSVIQQIAGEANLQSDVNVSTATATWLQVNESNLAFLMRQLSPYDVGLRIDGDQLRARDDDSDPQPVALDPNESALNIRLIADLNQLPREVKVKGYNLESDSETDATSSSITPAPSGQSGTSLLSDLGWEGESTLPHPFARSQQEAESLATKQFRMKANRFIHGEIICRGTIDLRSGREVQLNNVSPRLAGRYRVMECWHQFDMANGLRTRIKVQRPDWSR